ncbi:hypothetical protein [Flavobacterium silvaticum]|uniref:Lipoprotein n=1 Tax=Flavobacterium silvaticum TaxID=1852020 RepID=A0A972FPU9_9FLAO|nr:hypothetical protein [Flavobacterium silvaticum]NMH29170.1 hypothetical protein [Flavobacterium silvaticum]
MKRIHAVSVLILLLGAFQFTSCEVEPLDPAVLTETPQNPTDPTNPTNPGDDTPSEGDYWPAALNNSWTFDNGTGEYDMKIVSINSIDGYTYYTFNPQTGTSGSGMTGTTTVRMRKAGGNYYYKYDDVVIAAEGEIPGSTTTGSEVIILKDNIAVGQTWTQSYTQTTTYTNSSLPVISITNNITGTIVEKGATVTVDGESYSNVIKTKVVNNAVMMGVPAGTSTSYYYFSKDVGPIKFETEGLGTVSTSDLVEYTLN